MKTDCMINNFKHMKEMKTHHAASALGYTFSTTEKL